MRCALLVILLVACGPKGGGGGGSGPEAPPKPLGPGEWQNMSKSERVHFMKTVVKPTMQKLFQEFSPTDFADFDCSTCHGTGARTGTFAMPNPDLPRLAPDEVAHPEADNVEITEFMKTKVRPTVSQLLGIAEWSPDHPDGFGCFNCHTQPQ